MTSTSGVSLPSLPNASSLTTNALVPVGNDAHFFEESIHPSTVKASLSSLDPSSSASTQTLLKGMKWLLAMMSKGRDLSDFFPAVVKLVGAQSLEARKMVYMYLVHYADHDDTCRELALLSINSFQRGLADGEQLIRALALRVMSSIRVSDILQIQILAVQKCANDPSPYVRKCAANAISKLHSQCSITEKKLLKDLIKQMLTEDGSTMVLTSVIIAFWELYPNEYEMLHGSYRKLCHLLTDMDEWGQVIVMECLARYCRKSFRKPLEGSAESVDKQKRVKRSKVFLNGQSPTHGNDDGTGTQQIKYTSSSKDINDKKEFPKKVKRRIVKKAFYSDEEDQSSEEEVYASSADGKPITLAAAFRQPEVSQTSQPNATLEYFGDGDYEDEDLDPDHRLLLRSSLPLLKSRNSAVVLAVCSLHYYCGVSSIKTRTALGKALVRIHRDRREIQYVVLTSIRHLVEECPSAFTPFLADFFVKAMDPSFTRMIKLDILTYLAIEPQFITDILHEIRTYVRHNDKKFVCASIKAVDRITEISKIVFERVIPDEKIAHKESDLVGINCLHALVALTRVSTNKEVIGQSVIVITNIFGRLNKKDTLDPNDVRGNAIQRSIYLLTRSMAFIDKEGKEEDDDTNEDDDVNEDWNEQKDQDILCLSVDAMASALWLIGEWYISSKVTGILKMNQDAKSRMNCEILRLLARTFLDFEPLVKLQAVHYASKMLLSEDSAFSHSCSNILAQGRLDINPDVRDRARFESALVSVIVPTLVLDTEDIKTTPANITISRDKAKSMLLAQKSPSTTLPLETSAKDDEIFRFGTLSSLLQHRAGEAYLALPPWADVDSDKKLRDPPVSASNGSGKKNTGRKDESIRGFYDDEYSSDEEDTSSSDTSDSSDSSDESSDEDSSSEDDSSDESSEEDSSYESSEEDEDDSESEDESDVEEENRITNGTLNKVVLPSSLTKSIVDESSEESEESSEEASSSDDMEDSSEAEFTQQDSSLLLPMSRNTMISDFTSIPSPELTPKNLEATNPSDDFAGLSMAPLVLNKTEEILNPDVESDSGQWYRLIRPEVAGGLALDARYVRGATRKRELNLAEQEIEDSTVVLQVKFENQRTDLMAIRRIRFTQRKSPTLVRAILPPEIAILNKNQSSSLFLILSFGSSHNISSFSARFDVKSDKSSTAIDIRPPLVEMLGRLKLTEAEFDEMIKKLSSPHQKMTSSLNWKAQNNSREHIEKYCNLTFVSNMGNNDYIWKFSASLPHTKEVLCIVIDKKGPILIHCDNAIAANAILDSVKSMGSV